MSKGQGKTATHFFHLGSESEPFLFANGDSLPGITVAYEMYGKLNAKKNNAILLFHALSGSQHAAGRTEEIEGLGERWTDDVKPGWWDLFIGPGKALDTTRYCIICANYLGGCYGSSGPTSINPATGKPYGKSFPPVLSSDVVRSQIALLDHLGISQLHAVIGASVGGLLALNLATLYPERVRIIIPVATGLKTTVLTRLTLFEQVMAIENDPHFHGGDYYEGPAPEYGLALARMISHKTFVHLDAIEKRAKTTVSQPNGQLSWYKVGHNVESYMLHQGKKFVKRFDANSYLRIINMWLRFDPLRDAGVDSYEQLFARSTAAGHHYLVFSIDSDFCFYPEEQAEMVSALERAEVSSMHITVHSTKGHDSFLLEPELYTPHLVYTLEGRWQKSSLDGEVQEVE
ncbi:homoserine O-acetyltransferase [Prosthecobacter fusiformis]|uniref:Homoserine O-acetyltransferase n=1 Tax=Prosthecobacter fusiformis TaxID=48464 RepID=A0A4R7SST4_9BACT|nr:homoserine O-acetyltransferase [Prosthecobacter fusiformis]TDU81546.1 homoserine O-acetyltransferase [Prosthecobacter fusiformis]